MPNFDLVLNDGQALIPKSEDVRTLQLAPVNIGVREGRIAEISSSRLRGARVVNCKDLVVFPGVIDSQVHFREPGMTHKEDLETGSKAAVLGGITTFFEMPNTVPPTTTEELFLEKLERARGRAWANYAFYIGGSPENVDRLADLENLHHCAGIKIFLGSSTGSLLVDDLAVLEKILARGKRRVIVHCEDEARLRERKHLALESADVRTHPVWRDVESAVRATSNLLAAARKTNRRVHVLHVSTAEELVILAKNKDIATVEALPQHLTFSAPECYERWGSKTQQNPPIREARHREALWQAVLDGTVDVIGSDHAPHTLEEKSRPYPQSPSGMPMVQTLLPLMLNHVNQGKLSLTKLAELVCENPRWVFGCQQKGRIAEGLDADFTLVDLKRQETIQNSKMASRSQWTPLDDMKVTGWPVATIVGGQVVMEEGELIGPPRGQPVFF